MKKIWLLLWISVLLISVCSATTWFVQLSEFLYWQTPNITISLPGDDYKCLEAEKIIKLFDTLSEHAFFVYKYYPNPWEWKNVDILRKYAEENESYNNLTKAIYPYVNDKLINKWDSVSLYCEDSDYLYEAWAFDVTWIIVVEDKIGHYTRPIDWGTQNVDYQYKEVFITLDSLSDEKVKYLPYVKWNKIFIWCEDDTKNRLNWNWRYNNTYHVTSKWFIDSYNWKPRNIEQELLQYKWKEISIRFYLFPGYIKKDYEPEVPCENIWMLGYKVK